MKGPELLTAYGRLNKKSECIAAPFDVSDTAASSYVYLLDSNFQIHDALEWPHFKFTLREARMTQR